MCFNKISVCFFLNTNITRRLMEILSVHKNEKNRYLPHEQTTTGRGRKIKPVEEEAGEARGAELFNDTAPCRQVVTRQVRVHGGPQGVTLCSDDKNSTWGATTQTLTGATLKFLLYTLTVPQLYPLFSKARPSAAKKCSNKPLRSQYVPHPPKTVYYGETFYCDL